MMIRDIQNMDFNASMSYCETKSSSHAYQLIVCLEPITNCKTEDHLLMIWTQLIMFVFFSESIINLEHDENIILFVRINKCSHL